MCQNLYGVRTDTLTITQKLKTQYLNRFWPFIDVPALQNNLLKHVEENETEWMEVISKTAITHVVITFGDNVAIKSHLYALANNIDDLNRNLAGMESYPHLAFDVPFIIPRSQYRSIKRPANVSIVSLDLERAGSEITGRCINIVEFDTKMTYWIDFQQGKAFKVRN